MTVTQSYGTPHYKASTSHLTAFRGYGFISDFQEELLLPADEHPLPDLAIIDLLEMLKL